MKRLSTAAVGMVIVMGWALVSMVFAQPHPYIEWTRTYGGSGHDVAKAVQITDDGGYIIVGYSNSFGMGGYDVWLLKTDNGGDTLWTRVYGGGLNDQGNDIQITADSGFIIAGFTESYGSGEEDFYLIKTDQNGNTQWTRTYGDYDHQVALSVSCTDDGGYIAAGYSYYYSGNYLVISGYILRTDSDGDSLWTFTFPGSAHCAKQTNDGGYLIAGSRSVVFGLSYMHAIKSNSNGVLQWARDYYYFTYHDPNSQSWNQANDFIQTSDGGFFLVGVSGNAFWYPPYYEGYEEDLFLVKTNSSGNQTWYQALWPNLDLIAYSVCLTQGGGYAVAGGLSFAHSEFWTPEGFYVLKKNIGLATEWSATDYGGAESFDIEQTPDRGYIIVGTTENYYHTGDVYIVKTGPDEPVIRPEIELSTTELDFGEVAVGYQESLPLTIYNGGDTTLAIWSISCNNSSFITNFDPLDSLIYPGDSLNLLVTFTPQDTGNNSADLLIENHCGDVVVELTGRGYSLSVLDEKYSGIPGVFALPEPYPNPFNAIVTIRYDVPLAADVRIQVYDVLGRKVGTLVNGVKEAEYHRVIWDAEDFPSGIYFVRMNTGEFVQTRKVVLLK